MRTLLDIGGAQAAWWACALGAGAGLWWPGVLTCLAVVALQLAIAAERWPLVATVIAAAAFGLLAETALVAGGLVTYAAPFPAAGIAPVWIITLWMAFATSVGTMSRALGTKWVVLGAALGALAAPPTYAMAQPFGALTLSAPLWQPLVAIGLLWAVAFPVLVAVWRRTSCCVAPAGQTGSPPA